MSAVPDAMTLLPLPRLLWDSLELALQTQVHRLAKDIAVTLGKPEAPLLKALKEERVKAYLVEAAGDEGVDLGALRCPVMCQKAGTTNILQPCGAPVAWHATATAQQQQQPRCTEHLFAPLIAYKMEGLPKVKELEELDELGGIHTHDTAGHVYNPTGHLCGKWDKESHRLFVFDVEGDDAAANAAPTD